MESFALLVLVGLASVGAMIIVPYILVAIAYMLFFAAFCVLVVMIVIAGIVGDYFYDKRMLRGEVKYRLSWYYRFGGWRVDRGRRENTHDYQNVLILDHRTNEWVSIVRFRDCFFPARYGRGWLD